MRDSILLYRSQIEAMRNLPADQFKAALLAMADYAMDGVTETSDPVAAALLGMAKPLIDKNNKNYENGKLGGRPQNRTITDQKPPDNPPETEQEPTDNPKDKGKRINIKESTPKGVPKKSAVRFTPPSREEVQAYIKERDYNVDADRFVDFYTSKGWMVGKNSMKDWKAAVRNWARSQRQESTAKGKEQTTKNRFNNFQQRDYDFAALERDLLKSQGGT